jgi:hypothetical protein
LTGEVARAAHTDARNLLNRMFQGLIPHNMRPIDGYASLRNRASAKTIVSGKHITRAKNQDQQTKLNDIFSHGLYPFPVVVTRRIAPHRSIFQETNPVHDSR